ncbi:MAG: SurA N-terminal domain-containing protein [Parachlamydiales bacterium]|nr:SurA N-terminal domain-containing protein [Parachlamydiales bacterium]
MLEFFRRYQKYLFLVITVMVISSFVFFGTFSTFAGGEERPDKSIGKMIDGKAMMLSEVQKLARFIATDRQDSMQGRGVPPNFCNDGVIRYDFIKDGLANAIVAEYFDVLKPDFESRLDKAKRYKSYAHPEAPFLSAKTVWDHFIPDLNEEITALQAENEVKPAIFSHLEKLYLYQTRLQPEMLRQILIYQHRQYPWLTIDQRLSYEDLAIFGFHSASDWFGHNFVDLVAQFILNGAAAAEEKGYQVTLQEAKGDLIHHFQETMTKLAEAKAKPEMNFHTHLRMLGFDEKSASEVWRKVLLFRRYFQDVGDAAFVDKLPFKDFAGYANETALVQSYRWPIQISSAQDLAELQFYIQAVSGGKDLPKSVLKLEEVEKKVPELVQKTVKAKVAEVSKKQIGLRATIKQVWDWETEDKNWEQVRKEFSLPQKTGKEERFKTLDESGKRSAIDAWARERIVDENPAWINEALAAADLQERTWQVIGDRDPALKADGVYYRIEELEVVKDKHILTFNEARDVLSKLVPKSEGEFDKEKTLFAKASKEALSSLQKDPKDPRWIQSGTDPVLDQFKLETKSQAILRSSKEDWMKEQAFMMLPDFWSPIHVADHGEIVFFYLQERKTNTAPILDQLAFGKETLSADAKVYATERLLEAVKKKHAIVIPVQKEDE